jgi:hypothetical protein
MGITPFRFDTKKDAPAQDFQSRAGAYLYSVFADALLPGGFLPAALARSLSALRRASLYGSRMLTQRFGTMNVLLLRVSGRIRSGYF